MSSIKTENGRVAYVTPGVFVDAGGWEIVMVNGKLIVKPIPPWDGYPILWSSILIAASLQRLATFTEKAELEPQLLKVADAILSEYSAEIKNMAHRLNPHIDFKNVPELRYVWLKMLGSDGGGIGFIGGHIVRIPGWNPELLIPLVGSLEHLAEVTDKKELKPRLKALAKVILDAYTPELKRVVEQQKVEELVHA